MKKIAVAFSLLSASIAYAGEVTPLDIGVAFASHWEGYSSTNLTCIKDKDCDQIAATEPNVWLKTAMLMASRVSDFPAGSLVGLWKSGCNPYGRYLLQQAANKAREAPSAWAPFDSCTPCFYTAKNRHTAEGVLCALVYVYPLYEGK